MIWFVCHEKKITLGNCDGLVGSICIDFVFAVAKFINIERFRVTDFAIRANLLRPPFVSSVSIGCLSAVISVNVHR